jgi:hypothetical protein
MIPTNPSGGLRTGFGYLLPFHFRTLHCGFACRSVDLLTYFAARNAVGVGGLEPSLFQSKKSMVLTSLYINTGAGIAQSV